MLVGVMESDDDEPVEGEDEYEEDFDDDDEEEEEATEAAEAEEDGEVRPSTGEARRAQNTVLLEAQMAAAEAAADHEEAAEGDPGVQPWVDRHFIDTLTKDAEQRAGKTKEPMSDLELLGRTAEGLVAIHEKTRNETPPNSAPNPNPIRKPKLSHIVDK